MRHGLFKSIIYFIFLLNQIFSNNPSSKQSSNILEIKTLDDYFSTKESHQVVVVFFYNSKKTPKRKREIEKIITNMQKLSNLKRHDPIYAILDLDRLSFFNDHYDFTQNDNLFLLVSNQLVICTNYHEIWKDHTFSTQNFEIKFFLENTLNKFSQKVEKMEEIVNITTFENTAIYFGKNNTNYEVFKIAEKHFLKLNFFYTFDLIEKYSLLQYFGMNDEIINDSVLFIRKTSSVNSFDHKVILYNKEKFEVEDLKYFLEFSNLPKLRGKEFYEDIFIQIMQKEQILFMFCASKDSKIEEKYIFEQALEYLPRGLIYVKIDPSENESSGFANLLIFARSFLQEGKFYFVYNDAGVIKSESFWPRDQNVVEVIEFVKNFLVKHKRLLPYFKNLDVKNEEDLKIRTVFNSSAHSDNIETDL